MSWAYRFTRPRRKLLRYMLLASLFGVRLAAAKPKDAAIETSKCLAIRVQAGQEFGNVFSRTIAFKVDGYDPFVRRVSGTGFYRVQDFNAEETRTMSTFLYDGNAASTGETAIKDGGRTVCWKGDCSVSTDASGPTINPLLWGFPKGQLHTGQTWTVDITVPWEVAPPGKQTVRVMAVDPLNDTVTLERSGSGAGDSINEFKKLSLVRDKKTYAVEVSFGEARWTGITTFRRGLILSDSLLVMRPVAVKSPEFGNSTGIERQYILLNASPPDLLRDAATERQ